MLFGGIADIIGNMKIEITNLAKKRIKADFVKKVIRKTLELACADLKLSEISVVFVSEEKIRRINRKYRRRDKSTDVLSFDYSLGYNEKEVSGEIILCLDVIGKNACENKIAFSRELAFVLSHGILHILGMRHGEKMYGIQDKVCESLRITLNYETENHQ